MVPSSKAKSPCCSVHWNWEQIGGMRVFKQVGRRKVYRVLCSKCGMGYNTNSAGKVVS